MSQSHYRLYAMFVAVALVGCTSGGELAKPKLSLTTQALSPLEDARGIVVPVTEETVIATSGAEYFSEDKYGVKASPRVAGVTPLAMNASMKQDGTALVAYAGQGGLTPPPTKLKRGGGRAQIGKPYTIRGKRFVPRKQPNYNRTGLASWYGSAFHGRLTANGEVYDMNHLTAAHPTLPLPSYVRVTNASNGRSVIVRVNDRGPFAHNRIIDLSRRAAVALGTTKAGVAKVNVKYIGPAPVHGNDDAYLLASYRAPGIRSGGDQLIAALPQSISSRNNPMALKRPQSPLSFAPVPDEQIQTPYAAHSTMIFVPKGAKVPKGYGDVSTDGNGTFITLNKLANANEALRMLWSQGFDNAMFLSKIVLCRSLIDNLPYIDIF